MKLLVEITVVGSSDASVRQVEAGQSSWKFPLQQQENEQYFRTKCAGNFVLGGADFAWLRTQYDLNPCCAEVQVNVFTPACDGDSADTLLWPGYFLLTAVKWNFSACTATVTELLPRDGYDALYRVWETPVNVLKASSAGGSLFRYPFVAAYRDFYTWQPDPQGQLRQVLPDGNKAGTGRGGVEHAYTQGVSWLAFLTKLVVDTCYGTTAGRLAGIVESDFYSLPVDPVTKRPNRQKVVLAGSDAKRPSSNPPAVNLTITLKDLLEDLKALHNVWHVINPDTGQLRLEHLSWFAEKSYQPTRRVSLNLTKFPEALDKANNESIDLEKLYGFEELVISNNAGLFPESKTGNVTYDGGCTVRTDKGEVQKNTMTVQKIWTDLYGGYRNPDQVPDDSIFLCDTVPAHTYGGYTSDLPQMVVLDNPAEYPGFDKIVQVGPNGYQSATLLFIDYHRHGRSFSSGLVNKIKQSDGTFSDGMRLAMHSTKNTRRQEGITIPLCCSDMPINLDGYLKTQRFERCQLDKAEFDPTAETLKLDVVTDSRCQVVIVTPPDPGDDCKPAGTKIESRIDQTYCDQNDRQEIVATYTTVDTFADGECGTYEIPQPTVFVQQC